MDTEKTFEQYMDELEHIVETLEDRDTPLDKAMALFSEGVDIARKCNEKLENAQQSVKVLLEQNGALEEKDFVSEDE